MGIAYADLILKVLEIAVPSLVRESVEFARVRQMVAEGREPNATEWDELFLALRTESARLAAAVAVLESREAALRVTF